MDVNDQPNSICHVQAIQMYQLPNGSLHINLPFTLLNGEAVVYHGHSVEGLIVLTNYRLFLQLCERQHHVPLGLIEIVENKDLFYLTIGCKDARSYRCTFDSNEECMDWYNRLLKTYMPPKQLEELFAFFYYAWTKEKGDDTYSRLTCNKNLVYDETAFKNEVERLKFNLHGAWRISSANKNYKLCPSYPSLLLVPACISDDTLEIVAKFRSSKRIPTVVWRHPGNGAVIARCSQPEVGWLGWRSAEDEDLIKAISDACTFDRGHNSMLDNSHSPTSTNSEESGQTREITIDKKKVLIMDARSYTTAVANRARGGGCECPEYYPNCEMQFMNLANIHTIRKSFNALRLLCVGAADQPNWYSQLEGTRWLQHMSGVMKAALTLVNAVENEAKPVLVHCSDGWDRTPQIVALAELMLDPYYRTMEGFRILIEREWLAFGHKFADRCGQATGSDDPNERCPVFLQWLDCVHQILTQFEISFEFSHTFLVKLAQHTYSHLFGTFLCNTKQERVERVNDNTFSVWSFLNSPCFRNYLYKPANTSGYNNNILWPQCNIRDLRFWSEVYLGSLEMKNTVGTGSNACPGPPISTSHQMTKTRSYGDLMCAADIGRMNNRRKSDPSIVVDLIPMKGLNMYQANLSQGDIISLGNTHHTTNGFEMTNGCTTPTPSEYLNNDLVDGIIANCNVTDCIYKNTVLSFSDDSADLLAITKSELPNSTNCVNVETCVDSLNIVAQENDIDHVQNDLIKVESVDNYFGERTSGVESDLSKELESAFNEESNVINNQKTDMVNEEDLNNLASIAKNLTDVNGFESICLKSSCNLPAVHSTGDINHNDGIETHEIDSDTECTEPIESKSENTASEKSTKQELLNSIETSTETLTSDKVINNRLLPKQINGLDKLSNPDVFNGNIDFCKICVQNIKFIHGKHSHNSNSTSGKNSYYSTPPLYSRTPSGNGWETTFNNVGQHKSHRTHHYRLEDDGLALLQSETQERLWQIIEDHRQREEALTKELHTYRQALIKQVCHKCNFTDGDRLDDSCNSNDDGDGDDESSNSNSLTVSTLANSNLETFDSSAPAQQMSSVVDSVCSAGEGPISAVESLRSWEALEEGQALQEGTPTLWVPDHAVSRCTGCQTQFWLGRRKHHCRNCGRIFCADCSENSTPLPSEQLYSPVRVCTACYNKLHRGCGEVPEQCKHGSHQTATANPQQITASSN